MNTPVIRRQGEKMNFKFLYLTVLLAGLLAACGPAAAPATPFKISETDLAAIRQTASDYIDGWYTGNAERMERSLYDQLAKRWITSDQVDTTTKWQMIDMTKAGGGKNYAGDKTSTVTILDVYDNIAMVKTISAEYVDYVQMGKVNGKWIIINVLWAERKAE
jgi:Putative lumazine-binding